MISDINQQGVPHLLQSPPSDPASHRILLSPLHLLPPASSSALPSSSCASPFSSPALQPEPAFCFLHETVDKQFEKKFTLILRMLWQDIKILNQLVSSIVNQICSSEDTNLLQIKLLKQNAGVLVRLSSLLIFGFDNGLHALMTFLQQLLQSGNVNTSIKDFSNHGNSGIFQSNLHVLIFYTLSAIVAMYLMHSMSDGNWFTSFTKYCTTFTWP